MSLIPELSDRDHIQGNPNASLVLLEYGDYQCPDCGRAYPVVKQLQDKLGNRLKFAFRNFPLSKIHPQAMEAAVAAEASGLYNKFWEMHDVIFENQRALNRPSLIRYATMLGLDKNEFEKDLANSDLLSRVMADFKSGIKSGVNGTPTFFINGERFNQLWDGDKLFVFISKNYFF